MPTFTCCKDYQLQCNEEMPLLLWKILSRKFWSAENYGPGPKLLEKIGPGGPILSGNFGPGM